MIVEGYTLDLYCDCEDCKNKTPLYYQRERLHGRESFEEIGEHSRAEAWRTAKKHGWKKSKDGNCVYAKGHTIPKEVPHA